MFLRVGELDGPYVLQTRKLDGSEAQSLISEGLQKPRRITIDVMGDGR